MRIGLYQARTGLDPAANARDLAAAVADAAAGGAAILFTPEMSGLLDRDRERAAAQLRSEADDPVLAAVRDAAAAHGIWVHLGSLALAGERQDGRLVNRGFLIDDSGGVRARYDKITSSMSTWPMAKAGGSPPPMRRESGSRLPTARPASLGSASATTCAFPTFIAR
jgi:predicted amidohydrolase